ncbi:MAG: endonuclease/exonuclease/phosphatase family protein [Betaproteobacteria bacterium]|nr:endonuclease/exonuclease/phosphatase family protein [Betaproteobacteria bacterium]
MRPNSLAHWQALDAELSPECLRVASYNVHGCVGADGRRDPARIAAVIAELGCDTIGVQEAYAAESVAAALGMRVIAGPDHAWHDRHVGNALLTRREVLAVRHHDFGLPGREPRTAIDAELLVGGRPLRMIVTHLGVPPRERRHQVRKLLRLIKETAREERVVVLGDINEWLPLGRPLRWMHALLGRSPAERSFPSRWPLFALDRVWVRPRHALLAFGAHRSPLAALASDHLPVKAIVAKQNGPCGPS